MARERPRDLMSAFHMDAPYITEARRLLQRLARETPDAENRVYQITSAGRGEGKSTMTAILGLVAARVFKKRTLVIDADLRRPTMHRLLGGSQRPGLADLLNGRVSVEVAVRATSVPTLSMIASGVPVGPVGEAYNDAAFRALLRNLRPHFAFIFVDTPPVVPVVEPQLIAEHVDGILIVAMAGHTPVTLVRRMRQILAPVENKVVGVILNNAAEGLPYYYDHRYYGYDLHEGTRIRVPRPPTDAPGSSTQSVSESH